MYKLAFSFLLASLLLWGCATRTSTAGRDFDSSKVNEIEKGVTTTSQVLSWFGEPYSKVPVSASAVKWHYGWARTTANVTPGVFGRTVDTKGMKKSLWLFIQNDVIVNYTYEEGPFEKHTKSGQ